MRRRQNKHQRLALALSLCLFPGAPAAGEENDAGGPARASQHKGGAPTVAEATHRAESDRRVGVSAIRYSAFSRGRVAPFRIKSFARNTRRGHHAMSVVQGRWHSVFDPGLRRLRIQRQQRRGTARLGFGRLCPGGHGRVFVGQRQRRSGRGQRR